MEFYMKNFFVLCNFFYFITICVLMPLQIVSRQTMLVMVLNESDI